jgi:protein subunit release factor B
VDSKIKVIPIERCHMITFAVSPQKQRVLFERMKELGVTESELRESFIRSSGKGGQHVNKTSTCVHLVHLPTGIEVKCMKERSQSLNRFLARRELLEKIAASMGLPTMASLEADKIKKRKSRAKRRSAQKDGFEKAPAARLASGEE